MACCVGVCCVGACFTERRASSALGVKTVACAGGGTRTGTLGSTWGSQNCWVGASTVRFRPSLGSGPLTSPLTSQRGANTVIKATGVEPGVVMALNEMFGDGMTRDVGASLAAAVGAYLWVKMFDILASKNVLERKLSRKLIHTSCGPFFMLTWPLFSSSPEVGTLRAASHPFLISARMQSICIRDSSRERCHVSTHACTRTRVCLPVPGTLRLGEIFRCRGAAAAGCSARRNWHWVGQERERRPRGIQGGRP